jgi:putative tryptophan/tyrosine transport system substrate-binding protein
VRRREFIILVGSVVAVWPEGARAQRGSKPPMIGFLAASSVSAYAPLVAIVVRRLGELGWIEGRDAIIEYRYAEGIVERAGEIAAEFVRMKVDVILTAGDSQALAAKRATTAIPIVFAAAGDPVGNGLIQSLARPGGNVTGLSLLLTETAGKRLELLREVVPGLSRLAIFGNLTNPTVASELNAVLAAANTLGLATIKSDFRRAEDIEPAIQSLNGRAEALYVCNDPTVNTSTARINQLALDARLPVINAFRFNTEAGGLISYGPDVFDMFRRAAELVDKILRGARPADIPVEQPTKFDLVVNMKTAKILRLTIPKSYSRAPTR